MAVAKKDIEGIFPIRFMQKALLYHHLMEGVDQGMIQVQATLKGKLNHFYFQEAWKLIFDRHATLRATIHWEKLEKPVQVIRREVSFPWELLDWQHLSKSDQKDQLEALLKEDQAHKFNLSKAPTNRLVLIQLDADTHQLLWTSHHILLDGWSAGIVLQDVFTAYEQLSKQKSIDFPAIPKYQSYLHWLKSQSLDQAEIFWHQYLAEWKTGNTFSTLQRKITPTGTDFEEQVLDIPADTARKLEGYARKNRVTMNSLLQGLWGLVMSRFFHRMMYCLVKPFLVGLQISRILIIWLDYSIIFYLFEFSFKKINL